MYTLFGVILPNTHWISKVVVFLISLVGQLHSDQTFFSPPPIQNSTKQSTWMVSPSMSGIICVMQICGGSNRTFLHCIPKEDNVHAWHDVKADTDTNKNIKGTWKDIIFLPALQNFSTSLGVGSLLLLSLTPVKQVHHCHPGDLCLWGLCQWIWSSPKWPVHPILTVN